MNEANFKLMLRSSVISQGNCVVSFVSPFISGPIKFVFKIHKKSIHRTQQFHKHLVTRKKIHFTTILYSIFLFLFYFLFIIYSQLILLSGCVYDLYVHNIEEIQRKCTTAPSGLVYQMRHSGGNVAYKTLPQLIILDISAGKAKQLLDWYFFL